MQIEFLEVRLAEVMAYADIPINMRPTLTAMDGSKLPPEAAPVALLTGGAGGGAAVSGGVGGFGSGAALAAVGALSGIKATQLELVRSAMLNCLKMLQEMSIALGE